jgi:hypothetical protein
MSMKQSSVCNFIGLQLTEIISFKFFSLHSDDISWPWEISLGHKMMTEIRASFEWLKQIARTIHFGLNFVSSSLHVIVKCYANSILCVCVCVCVCVSACVCVCESLSPILYSVFE